MSSISRPTDSDSAISVSVFSEAEGAEKMCRSAMGSVRPVIAVVRQEARNRNDGDGEHAA